MEGGLIGNKYEPVKRIGHGSYGSVYLARPRRNGSGFVVLKRVFVVEEGAKEHREAINEVKLLQRLRHKNIVAYRDSFVHDNYLCIVMAYCAGGDLQAQVKCAREAGVIFTREQVVDWTSQILQALRYLHQDKHILHRDLKSQNVFLVPERVLVSECCHALPPTSSSRGKGLAVRGEGQDAPEAGLWQLEKGDVVYVTHRVRGGWAHCSSSALPPGIQASSSSAATGEGGGGAGGGGGGGGARKGYVAVEHLCLSPLPRDTSVGGATVKLGDFGISKSLSATDEMANTVIGTPYCVCA